MRVNDLTAESARLIESDDLSRLLALDNQLCFALYATANAMTRAYRSALSELGLTFPQYLVLLSLWEENGLSVSELGSRLRLDSGTLTPLLKRLEHAGLVERKRRFDDERVVEINLTAEGKAIREHAAGARANVVCRLGMNEAEIAQMRQDLVRLLEQLSLDTAKV